MKLKKLAGNIYHLNFPTQRALTTTFLRFQEHYESPQFRGKVFTLETYKTWYSKHSSKGKATGKFTYYTDWNGFNIPSHILKPFYQGKFDPLSSKEKKLLKLCKPLSHKPFYLIGTYGKRHDHTLQHEIAHGLFYTIPAYRKKALAIVKKIKPAHKKTLKRFLAASGGYHKDVWLDEMHGYLMTDSGKLKKKGIDTDKYQKSKKSLNALFQSYFKKLQ